MPILYIRDATGNLVPVRTVQGPAGPQGPQGEAGASIVPEFANSTNECVDTSKLYVLPDGYIYAYMTKTTTVTSTNQIPRAENADGTEYVGTNGEDGYKTGCKINSSGAEAAASTHKVTGFMKAKFGDMLRFSGIGCTNASATRIAFYDASHNWLNGLTTDRAYAAISAGIYTINEDLSSYAAMKSIEDMAYVRLSVETLDGSSKMTVNEPLEGSETTKEGWYSTGHAFVPADYEDRIVDLEKRATSLENRVDELSVGTDDTFTYVAEEAKRVADIVKEKQTVGGLTFTAMSDMHIRFNDSYWADNLASCRDAGLGLAELRKVLNLDFVAMLGDYTVGGASDTAGKIKEDLTGAKGYMAKGAIGIPSIWCTGNHDINYGANTDRRMTEDELYAYLTGNNQGTIQDGENIGRNYGYIDFENQKIRCIYLNTVDALDYPDNDGTADDAMEITAIQAQWLVNVGLDLSEKKEPTKWGIVLFSHHCLSQFQPVMAILTAYRHGESGSVEVTTNGVTTTVNYDFASANRGEIICAVHGHDHNFTYRKISTERWDKVTEANAWLWSICVPNIDTKRNNEKATNSDEAYKKAFGEFDSSGEPVYYPKAQGTAASTSFCVFTINRKNRKIHAIHYGAGIDREIDY